MKALLSKTSKMNCHSWGISAWMCKVGEALSKVEGSTCEKCYARRNMYHMPNVKDAQDRRWQEYQMAEWPSMMIDTIQGMKQFRWFDSGDLQDLRMLKRIVTVVTGTPSTKHWLPTREKGVVQEYLTLYGSFPSNLVVRISMPMIGMVARVRWPAKLRHQIRTSTVGADDGFQCPAYQQGGKCGSCSACWSHKVGNINYPQH